MIGTSPYDLSNPKRLRNSITARFTNEEISAISQRVLDDGCSSLSQWLRVQGLAGMRQPEEVT